MKRRFLSTCARIAASCVGAFGLVVVSCQVAYARPIMPAFSLLTSGISVQTGAGLLALGPDGSVWSTLAAGLGRFDARGVLHPAPVRATGSFRPYLVSAHDGSLWVVSPGERSTVTLFARDGASTSVPIDGLIGGATLGPDEALWVTLTGQLASDQGLYIDRIAADGSHRAFTVHGLGGPTDLGPIATGADGNLWFASNTFTGQGWTVAISRLSPVGQLSSWAVGAVLDVAPRQSIEAVGGVAAGPGGVWFTLADDRIGRIGYDGVVRVFSEAHGGSPPMALTQGPDRAMWFTQYGTLSQLGTPALGRVDFRGHITVYPWRGLAALAGPATPQQLGANSIVTGPDGTLWFSIPGINAVGRFSLRGNCTVPSLLGRGLVQAEHLLTIAGCRPRLARQHGTVVSAQSEPAGTLLHPGAPVAITTTSKRAAAERCLAAPGQRPLVGDAHFRLLATLQTQGTDTAIAYFLCRMRGTGIHPAAQIPGSTSGEGYTSTTSLFTFTSKFLAWQSYYSNKYGQQGGSVEVLDLATSTKKTYPLARTSGGEFVDAATRIALDGSGNVAWLQPGAPQVGPQPNPDIIAAGLANSTATILDTGPPGSLGAPSFTTDGALEWTRSGRPQTYRYR